MGYESHSTFVDPENEDERIWRYMSFAKLTAMLDSSSLWFARLDSFADPFEGSASLPSVDILHKWYLAAVSREKDIPPENIATHAQMLSLVLHSAKASRLRCCVSCWHLSSYESEAMWALYRASGDSVAIRTTYRKLKVALQAIPHPVYLGKVHYIDYRSERFVDPGNMFSLVLHKRKSFEHEKEVRAVLAHWHHEDAPEGGVPMKIDLAQLIDAIHVSPSAPKWFGDIVRTTVARFGFPTMVVQSELLDTPAFPETVDQSKWQDIKRLTTGDSDGVA